MYTQGRSHEHPQPRHLRLAFRHDETAADTGCSHARIPARTLSSDSIFRGEREIGIEHHGALYRLKVTRQGKLILNK